MLGMTKAMYNIKTTFKEMIELHQKEVETHQNLIDEFRKQAVEVDSQEKQMVFLLEAHRNKEHQKGHLTMIDIYKYLEATKC